MDADEVLRILRLSGNVVCLVARRNRQPGLMGAEARIFRVIPLHGRTLSVTSLVSGPAGSAFGIFHVLLPLGIVILHAKLFAVVHDGRAAQREVESGHQFRDVVVVGAIAVPVIGAFNIVVADHPRRPATGSVCGRDLPAEFRRR